MLCFYKTINNAIVRVDTITEGCWVNAVSPTVEEINFLTNELNVDRDFVSAALDEEESSRIETEDDQTLIIIDTPLAITEGKNTLVYTTMPIGIIVTQTNVVTVCLNETSAITDIANGFVKNIQTGMKTRFLLTLLLRIAQSFLIRLKHINKMSSHFENELHKSMKNKELIQLLGLEKSLVYFSTSLKANEITLEKILRGRVIKLYEEDQELLEDVLIEFKQAIEMSNIYSSILSGTMDAFASIISNNLNIVMKLLTIITTLMAIPTMIFSYYGMNVNFGWTPAWWMILSFCVVLVGVSGFFLWRKRY
ncbi:MAG: magnesium transporter CorA family protein [Oscillospiraceae bacterium]